MIVSLSNAKLMEVRQIVKFTCGECCRSWCRTVWRLCLSHTVMKSHFVLLWAVHRWNCGHFSRIPLDLCQACWNCEPKKRFFEYFILKSLNFLPFDPTTEGKSLPSSNFVSPISRRSGMSPVLAHRMTWQPPRMLKCSPCTWMPFLSHWLSWFGRALRCSPTCTKSRRS